MNHTRFIFRPATLDSYSKAGIHLSADQETPTPITTYGKRLMTGPSSSRTTGWLSITEQALWVAGIVLLLLWLGARSHSLIMSHFGLWQFQAARTTSSVGGNSTVGLDGETTVDFRLWSSKRIQAFRESFARTFKQPIAVLRIPSIQLTAPVFDGTDDLTLNRGLGRIAGTGMPGDGNLGIAGHRDGFFRSLKDIAPGDPIEITTHSETDTYVVERTEIVSPDNVSVLNPQPKALLTLVTCYPFYFVGDAPRRFIVEASLQKRGNHVVRTEPPSAENQGQR